MKHLLSLFRAVTTTSTALLLLCSCSPKSTTPSEPLPDKKPEKEHQEPKTSYTAVANEATDALIDFFWNPTPGFFCSATNARNKFEYWPNAHALDVLTDAYIRTGEDKYKDLINKWHDGVKRKNTGWWKTYYDDMEWTALAVQRAHQVAGDEKFDAAAVQIWKYIKKGWTDELGGGIIWRVDLINPSKNACSNAPAGIYAARQYKKTKGKEYLDWADKIYDWQRANLFDEKTGAVYDNIIVRSRELNKQSYTYNQGTFIGCAVELYTIHGEEKYLKDAVLAADFTLNNLVRNGVLVPGDHGDGGLFNGIFLRYLEQLIRCPNLDQSKKNRYTAFILANANTLLEEGRTPEHRGLYGPDWQRKVQAPFALTPQLSAAMLLDVADSLTRDVPK